MNTNASNQTQYFGFPLFSGTDKPSVLTDWNGTMEELDSTLEDYRVRIAGCEQTTASFMDQVNILKAKFVEVETRISADEGLIQDNALEIAALKEAMIVADTSIKRVLATLTSIETKNAEQDTAIDGINSHLNTVDETLASLASDIQLLNSAVNNDRQNIHSLQNDAARLAMVDNQFKTALADQWDAETHYLTYDRVFVYKEVMDVYGNMVNVPAFYVATQDVPIGIKPDTEGADAYWSDYFNVSTDIRNLNNAVNFYSNSMRNGFESVDAKIDHLNKPFMLQGFEGFYSGTNYDNYITFDLAQNGYIQQMLASGSPVKIYGVNLYSTGNVFDNPPFLPFNATMLQVELSFTDNLGNSQTLTRDLIPSQCVRRTVDGVNMTIVRFTTSSEIYLDPSHLRITDGHASMQFKFGKEFSLDEAHTPINFLTSMSGVTYGGLIFAY